MKAKDLIDVARRLLFIVPVSATGKRLHGVNARRRRQARFRADCARAVDQINRLIETVFDSGTDFTEAERAPTTRSNSGGKITERE